MDITSEKTAPATAEPAAHVSGLSRAAMCLLGASLMLIAFNLRPIFASLSVLLPEIVEQTGLSSAAAGYLTTLPVLCLGLFAPLRSEEHTSELQSLMRISYAVFCLKKKK